MDDKLAQRGIGVAIGIQVFLFATMLYFRKLIGTVVSHQEYWSSGLGTALVMFGGVVFAVGVVGVIVSRRHETDPTPQLLCGLFAGLGAYLAISLLYDLLWACTGHDMTHLSGDYSTYF